MKQQDTDRSPRRQTPMPGLPRRPAAEQAQAEPGAPRLCRQACAQDLPKQTLHVHSRYVDGADTPAAMAEAALSAGLSSLGFSEHAFVPVPVVGEPCWMTPEATARYLAEVRALRKHYAGRLEIFVGLELDSYGYDTDYDAAIAGQLDYRIGSVHMVPGSAGLFAVDESRAMLEREIEAAFGGDPLRLAARYYADVAAFAQRCRPDILGHIDLITKFDESGERFLENARAYRKLALEAVDAAIDAGCIIEINTGAIARGYRTTPYPRRFLLERVRERGGRITLSADAHSAAGIACGLAEAAALARSVGFAEYALLTEEGFVPTPL